MAVCGASSSVLYSVDRGGRLVWSSGEKTSFCRRTLTPNSVEIVLGNSTLVTLA